MENQIIETWEINNRVNLALLEGITPDGLIATMNPKGRNVGQQLAHLHNVRIMWLETSVPELTKGLKKIPKEEQLTKAGLKKAWIASAAAISEWLKQSLEKGKIKNYKKGIIPFLGYLIAHEAHHRGQVILHLKLSGHTIEKQLSFDIWDWNKI